MRKAKPTDNTDQLSIQVRGLKKSYGKLQVLEGVDFEIKRGEILALLGPNGAGKTTTIRILSTLIRPDEGEVQINGFDLIKDAALVRSSIGLTGQYAAVDEYLTGIENLEMIGRLYRLGTSEVKRKSWELLEQFDLVDAAKRTVKTYSGGMRRRLDLAMSLIASPPIVFLDEPTTGLDPRSRLSLWGMIKELAATNVTMLLTTQYMEEADRLADRVIVIDKGKVIAQGTPQELKAKVGSDRLELTFGAKSSYSAAKKLLKTDGDQKRQTITIPIAKGVAGLKTVLSKLERAKIQVESLSLHRPTLDDVFLSLTGHVATVEPSDLTNEASK